MRVGDGDLAELWGRGETEIRSWLRHHQPDGGDARAQWWEGLMTQALHGMYQADSDAARRESARLAHTTTDEAVRQAAMSEREGAIRIANLAVFYLSADTVDDAPFEVDSVVAECLDLIEIPLDVATEQAKSWKALPLEQILRLRTAKNLLNPCQRLGDRVTDPALRSRLSGWLRILDALP